MTRELVLASLPTAYGRWLTARTLRAAAKAGLSAKLVYIDRNDAVHAPDQGADLVLYVSYYPGGSLLQRAVTAQAPVIVALSPPNDAVNDMCAVQSCSFLQALRANTASASLITRLSRLPQVTLLTDAGRQQPAADALIGLADAFGLPRDCLDIEQAGGISLDRAILADLGEDRAGYAGRANLNDRALTLIQGVLSPIIEGIVTGHGQTIYWPYDVFLSGDALDTPAGIVADITGPARVIYYGPYCHLPDGVWRIKMIVGFSDDIGDLSFSVEVHCDGLLAHGSLRPDHGGLFATELLARFDRAEEPIEIRIRSEAGAIEGRIALGQVEFIPQSDPQ